MKAIIYTRYGSPDVLELRELMATGQVTPVIDRQYTLAELPEAMRYLGAGHAQGKVVVTAAFIRTASVSELTHAR